MVIGCGVELLNKQAVQPNPPLSTSSIFLLQAGTARSGVQLEASAAGQPVNSADDTLEACRCSQVILYVLRMSCMPCAQPPMLGFSHLRSSVMVTSRFQHGPGGSWADSMQGA